MHKIKLLLINEEEESALIRCLRESLASKDLEIAHNVSYISGKLDKTQNIIINSPLPSCNWRDQLHLILKEGTDDDK